MIKKILKSVREYKKQTILAPIFMIGEVLTSSIIPLLLSKLIDDGIVAGRIDIILKIGAILVFTAISGLILGVMGGKYCAIAGAGFAKNLRNDMYEKIQKFSFSNIDKFSTSSVITRITVDVSNVQEAFMTCIRGAIRAPAMILFAFLMTFLIDKKIACMFLFIAPVIGFLLIVIAKKAHPIFDRVFHTYDDLNNVVQENVKGVRVVKSFVKEEFEIGKFEKISNSIYKDFSKAESILAFNSPLMQFTIYTVLTCISWFGAKDIVAGKLTTGEITSLFTYAMYILNNLMMLSMFFVIITISIESARRIVEILDEIPDIAEPENPIFEIKDGSIKFENVSFSYNKDLKRACLKNINLDIKSGETVGIIGGTGSSKSSLVSLISRLYDVTEGNIKIGDVDVKDYDIKTLRDNVAVVLQKNELFTGTIKENLKWGNKDASDEEIVQACKLAQADEFISSHPEGYDRLIEEGGVNVSGGQKQRLCIARALLKKPKILILDDSTSAVDTKTDSLIRKAFRESIPNVTKLIIAQRISSVQDSDKILVLDNGEINGFGTHEELLKNNEIYKSVYYSQVKGEDDGTEK